MMFTVINVENGFCCLIYCMWVNSVDF